MIFLSLVEEWGTRKGEREGVTWVGGKASGGGKCLQFQSSGG
jgi:hypothetical protein